MLVVLQASSKKPTRAGLTKLVIDIAKKEHHTLEAGVADLVTLLAEGSYRDALSILEKIFSVSSEKTITLAEVERATGAPQHSLVLSFLSALDRGDAGKALVVLRDVTQRDVDMQLYLTLVLEALRTLLLIRSAPELRSELHEELGTDTYGELEKLANNTDSKINHKTLRVFLDSAGRMRFSPVPVATLELAVFELHGE